MDDEIRDRLIGSVGRLIARAGSSKPVPGEWTPGTVLGHVAEVDEQVWLARLNLMVHAARNAEGPPKFQWWEPDPVETAVRYEGWGLEGCAQRVLAARVNLVCRLKELTTEDWQARAVHATWGEVDVRGLLEHVFDHDEEHLASL